MDPKLDPAKLIGAASAPVALIISASIYLGNLTQKYNVLFQKIRELALELRQKPEDDRRESVNCQLRLYEKRIIAATRCTFCLNLAVILFVLTVLMTGLSTLLPGSGVMTVITAGAMALGLGIFVVAILIELVANRFARRTLDSELNRGTPQYEPVEHRQGQGG